jgi:hypothetical protein
MSQSRLFCFFRHRRQLFGVCMNFSPFGHRSREFASSEPLIVIAVIGVLVGLLLPGIRASR